MAPSRGTARSRWMRTLSATGQPTRMSLQQTQAPPEQAQQEHRPPMVHVQELRPRPHHAPEQRLHPPLTVRQPPHPQPHAPQRQVQHQVKIKTAMVLRPMAAAAFSATSLASSTHSRCFRTLHNRATPARLCIVQEVMQHSTPVFDTHGARTWVRTHTPRYPRS